ncbi:hypothetical protein V1514DRAFT_343476 [Lipomyces japonicus]|uniref:uncharacterized protein n=1 Tax=Lipomyces japonicus TaxID=56871 RepID=UPI0034CEE156
MSLSGGPLVHHLFNHILSSTSLLPSSSSSFNPSPFSIMASPLAPAFRPSLPPASPSSDGPPFLFSMQSRPLYCTSSFPLQQAAGLQLQQRQSLHAVIPRISASIPRGLRQEQSRWIAYRRNYIVVFISVFLDLPLSALPVPHLPNQRAALENHSFKVAVSEKNKNNDEEIRYANVKSFAVSITAEDEINGRPVELIQHSPRRDQGPRRHPLIVQVRPIVNRGGNNGVTVTSDSVGGIGDQLYSPRQAFASQEILIPIDEPGTGAEPNTSPFGNDEIAVFERIQFRKATANNGKKNIAQQQYRVVVILYAVVDDPDNKNAIKYVELQRVATVGIMVRGRSPGHFSDRGGLI